MTRTSADRFEELAAEALDGLPEWIRDRMVNVEVVIEDAPPDDQPHLLGRYHGIPLTQRSWSYAGVLPDRIALFRSTIEAQAGGDEQLLRRTISRTIVHEVAHLFGISDDRLRDLQRY